VFVFTSTIRHKARVEVMRIEMGGGGGGEVERNEKKKAASDQRYLTSKLRLA
jgi:hypothetical protein